MLKTISTPKDGINIFSMDRVNVKKYSGSTYLQILPE
jgi:hypothetical protein